MSEIAVDVRMIRHSGIGTYIQNLLPRMIRKSPDTVYHLIGDADILKQYDWTSLPNARVIGCSAPIYSLAEQSEIPPKVPRSADLYWSPHYIVPAMIRCPALVTIHDVFHLAMPQFVNGVHKRIYAKAMFQVIARKAAAVVCDSSFTIGEVKRLTPIDPAKLRRTYLGIDESWLNIVPEQNPHNRPYILYVGNVKPHKNLVALLSAFEMIAGKVPHDLVIVGQKEGFITGDAFVMQKADRLGDRVHFTGHIPFAELQQYFAHAECLVLPSLYEGFGLPPLEAMACGCPTVVSTSASLPEVCGDASLYIDPYRPDDIAEKISMLLEDETLRKELQAKGRKQAAKYCWDKTADEMVEICRGLSPAAPCT